MSDSYMTPEVTMLLNATLANPLEDGPRNALADEMRELNLFTTDKILKWVINFRGNDAPRYLYALWCELNGLPGRGEFIRVQIGLAKYAGLPSGGIREYDDLRARERSIPPECLDREVRQCVQWRVKPSWGRGFVAEVTCTAEGWLAHADAITAHQPIERAHLTTPVAFDDQRFVFGPRLPEGTRSPRWPGIAFTLPFQTASWDATTAATNLASIIALQQQWDQMSTSLIEGSIIINDPTG